jgi:hydroxyethylthiazole kinase-like sugar kinase family protein
MTTETPPDEVLLEAAKRGNMLHWGLEQLRTIYKTGCIFTALCDMIAKHEKPAVDRKLLCAREAMAENAETGAASEWGGKFRSGNYDVTYHITVPLRAIELWEEGFGK